MALTLFTRCEAANLSGTDDYSASDTTGTTGGSVAFNTTARLVGASGNGMQVTGAGDQLAFDADTTIINRLTGSIGFYTRIQTWAAGATFFRAAGSQYFYNIGLVMTGTDELRLWTNEEAGGADEETTDSTASNLATNTTYFITASWDQPNSLRRIRVYAAGGGSPIEYLDSTAFNAPADLVAADDLKLGDARGFGAAYYMDNFFLGNAYADADDFYTNRNIETYTSYSVGGGGSLTTEYVGPVMEQSRSAMIGRRYV